MFAESCHGDVPNFPCERDSIGLLPQHRVGDTRARSLLHPDLVSEVKAAPAKKLFAREIDPSFFHWDATSSFKEIRFGKANVQLTFHENDKKKIGDDLCIRVEPDIDYFKDLEALERSSLVPKLEHVRRYSCQQ